MVAPCIVRNFAAVEVACDFGTFYLNRERLEFAIEILKSSTGENLTHNIVEKMREKYPDMSPITLRSYLICARECVVHDVKP